MTAVVTHQMLPKQRAFLEATEREVGYSGAVGAGKTRALCLKALTRAVVPGAREALVRKHLSTLKATTLKTLLEPEGDLPPVLPRGSYSHNQTDKTIRIHGGGEIVYFALDDPDKLGSYNLSGCGIDEVVELRERDYTQLRGRIRLQCGLPNQLYWACNPGPPSHFVAKRFGLARGALIRPKCRVIETCTAENTFLPQDYIDDVSSFEGVARERFFLGRWVGGEGLVYDRWDHAVHVLERDPAEMERWLCAVDDGYTNPFAATLWGMDGDGRLHGFASLYERGWLMSRKVAGLIEMARDRPVEAYIVDPAAAELAAEMRDAGLPVPGKLRKDVFDGIQKVQQRLAVQGDGRPRLTIDPRCVSVAHEFATYEWRTRPGAGKADDAERIDEPRKESDHHMDAIRYLVLYLDRETLLPRL